MNLIKRKDGMTLIELIITVSILAIVMGAATFSLSGFLRSNQVNVYTNDLIQSLRKAQSNSMTRVKDSQWGVYLSNEERKFVFFKGSTYGEDSSYDITYEMPSTVWFETVELNDDSDEIVFEKVTGETDDYGTVVVKVKENDGFTLTINSLGQINKDRL